VYHWLFLVLFFIGSEIFCDEWINSGEVTCLIVGRGETVIIGAQLFDRYDIHKYMTSD
jgi:hypothetical protein